MDYVRNHEMKISEIEMTKSNNVEDIGVAVLLTLRMKQKRPHTEIIQLLYEAGGVIYIEEI